LGLCQNFILALDETAGVLLGFNVPELYIARRGAKERDPRTDNHGDPSDSQALNEPSAQKRLNRKAAINVRMLKTATCKRCYDLLRSPDHFLHDCPGRGVSERRRTQHENRLFAVGPRAECQNGLVRFATNDQRIYRSNKFVVSVRLPAIWGKEIESAVEPAI
jgi:hypothetical protein